MRCRYCGIELVSGDNWSPSCVVKRDYRCVTCGRIEDMKYRAEKHDEITKRDKRYYMMNRDALLNKQKRYYDEHKAEIRVRRGTIPMSENRSCPLYLGVHVAERVLAKVFNDVAVMPHGNPGYDFICGKGYKIDVKSSCYRKTNNWTFCINRNSAADYFLCVAFDNRDNLNPLHIWLIPGHAINTQLCATIRPKTLDKWSIYELDKLDDITTCCNVIRGE